MDRVVKGRWKVISREDGEAIAAHVLVDRREKKGEEVFLSFAMSLASSGLSSIRPSEM